MTLNVQGESLVAQEKPLANTSPVTILNIKAPLARNGTKTLIDVNGVHDIEVINSSTENNEQNQTSNKHEIIEEHKKNEIEEIYINNHSCSEEAKLKELESWKDNNVQETVKNQKRISVRWVCSVKQTDKGSKPKANLVARGFEEDSLNTFEKESPTASKDTLGTLLSTIITNNWNLKSIDIKTAFLQGKFLKRDAYLKPPLEAHCDNQIWKLNNCMYRLTEASLMQFKTVKKLMKIMEGHQLRTQHYLCGIITINLLE